jgi:hypothetical protein
MLIGNYSVLNKTAGRFLSGPSVSDNRSNWNTTNAARNQYLEFDKRSGIPEGAVPPYSWVMPQVAGGLSARIFASGTVASNLVMGRSISADLTGVGGISGSMAALVQLAASIGGSGGITGAMVGTITMAATLAGQGNISGAANLIARIEAILSGTGAVTADLKGKAGMSADIFVNSGTATTNELVAAIWNAVATSYNEAGTMGQKLNGAGSAGDPWGTALPGSYTGEQAGAIVDRLEDLIKQVKALTTAGL